jgi:plastocyanin
VRLPRRLMLPLAGLLGAALVALPAAAASESPSINAVDYSGYHYWYPPEVKVTAGGAVAISNPGEVAHGVEWKEGPETPSCSSGIPVGTTEATSGTKWSGSCTFGKPGTYTFWCTVHHQAMSARIVVGEGGTTTTTTPTTSQTTQSNQSGGGPTTTGPAQAGGSGTPTGPAPISAGAVRLAQGAHARFVRGSVTVPAADAGARLQIDLLAPRASLARTGASGLARVGRLVRGSVPAGTVPFRVSLQSVALRALRRHRHMTLTVTITISPPQGGTVLLSRRLLLRA